MARDFKRTFRLDRSSRRDARASVAEELELQVCQRKADSLAGVKVKLSIASSLASTYDSEGCLVRMLNSALRDCRAIQTSN